MLPVKRSTGQKLTAMVLCVTAGYAIMAGMLLLGLLVTSWLFKGIGKSPKLLFAIASFRLTAAQALNLLLCRPLAQQAECQGRRAGGCCADTAPSKTGRCHR